jgi:hypothetical protein
MAYIETDTTPGGVTQEIVVSSPAIRGRKFLNESEYEFIIF